MCEHVPVASGRYSVSTVSRWAPHELQVAHIRSSPRLLGRMVDPIDDQRLVPLPSSTGACVSRLSRHLSACVVRNAPLYARRDHTHHHCKQLWRGGRVAKRVYLPSHLGANSEQAVDKLVAFGHLIDNAAVVRCSFVVLASRRDARAHTTNEQGVSPDGRGCCMLPVTAMRSCPPRPYLHPAAADKLQAPRRNQRPHVCFHGCRLLSPPPHEERHL